MSKLSHILIQHYFKQKIIGQFKQDKIIVTSTEIQYYLSANKSSGTSVLENMIHLALVSKLLRQEIHFLELTI